MISEAEAIKIGTEKGKAAGSWIVDGNTKPEALRALLKGYEEGDPTVMDLHPAPLAGEWAGESISEVFMLFTDEEAPEEILDAYEQAHSEAFWNEVISSAKGFLGIGTSEE